LLSALSVAIRIGRPDIRLARKIQVGKNSAVPTIKNARPIFSFKKILARHKQMLRALAAAMIQNPGVRVWVIM